MKTHDQNSEEKEKKVGSGWGSHAGTAQGGPLIETQGMTFE